VAASVWGAAGLVAGAGGTWAPTGRLAAAATATATGPRAGARAKRAGRGEILDERSKDDRSISTLRPRSASGGAGRDEVPAPAPGDRDRDRIVRLQDALRDILGGRTLGHTRVGMRVASVATGRLFYARHADALMDPASNQKVLATTAALMRLGADWTYRTELSSIEPSPDGVIAGNLYLRGNGDPSLRAVDLSGWAAELRRRGITAIEGGVIADTRRLGDEGATAGGLRDEEITGSSPPAPLVVDRGVTLVRVHPGASAGAPAVVLTNPPSAPAVPAPGAAEPGAPSAGGGAEGEHSPSGFTIINRAVTKDGGRTRVTVQVGVSGGTMRIEVSGRIALGAGGVSFRRRVPHPGLHAAILLRAALLSEGIRVRDAAGIGGAPTGAGFALVNRSPPLSTLLRRINKDSDNDQAEHVLQTVGAEERGGPPTTEKGLGVLREVIGSLGLKPTDYVPKNGSGLGHANRITPAAMTELLTALYFDPRVGPDILQSLSVGGVDGTTRNRFKGTLAAHRVRVKTGTLSGKSCLSGLVGDGDEVLVFSMMMQGFRGRALHAVRASQVGAVNAMMRYVREGTGERIEWPTTFDESNVATDVETGGEIHESGEEGEQEGPDGVMAPTMEMPEPSPPSQTSPPPASPSRHAR
jgi:D-alanyl-D-alanine carboxypeptidase/D-alanyl-D-alanine-endopeptidase (penicillin-binding protein 4)